ncbi:hypothetical protein E2C01_016401 [Portunus trituberculatus]|uniref:Uncharacterized protein n=1 Tax=Portunus trituberculatus TaxID=210409 RepID=A0A5B7DQG4_PORTR|nr:hypothetical protein [Portunus trituberculatus]
MRASSDLIREVSCSNFFPINYESRTSSLLQGLVVPWMPVRGGEACSPSVVRGPLTWEGCARLLCFRSCAGHWPNF